MSAETAVGANQRGGVCVMAWDQNAPRASLIG